jgi:hypothetical protein
MIVTTIGQYSSPEHNPGEPFPLPSLHVGDFNFAIPPGESIIAATLRGQWGNCANPTTAHNKLYLDSLLVADTHLASPDPYGNSYVPWAYTFSSFSTLQDGQASFDVVQWSEWVVRLGTTTLTIQTAPMPEPSAVLVWSLVGAVGMALGFWRCRK